MTIRSLFFASYKDLAGTGELVLTLPASSTVADLVAQLRASSRTLALLPASPAVAVNMTYAALETQLQHGDEVAFIPPVAGG